MVWALFFTGNVLARANLLTGRCCIIVDEADGMFYNRNKDSGDNSLSRIKLQNTILSALSNINNRRIFWLCTTNRIGKIALDFAELSFMRRFQILWTRRLPPVTVGSHLRFGLIRRSSCSASR